MATKLTGRDAKQGDKSWTTAKALVLALILGGLVLIGLELYGTYMQPAEEEIDVPAQTTVPETGVESPPASATPDQSDQTGSGETAPSAQ